MYQSVSSSQNTGNNVYSTNQMDRVHNYEIERMRNNYDGARNATNSGIIPNAGFQQRVLNQNNVGNPVSHIDPQTSNNVRIESQQGIYSNLTGDVIENFTHNNMVPFFGGSVKQNIDEDRNAVLLARHTGRDRLDMRKTEVKSMFDVSRNVGYVNGAPAFRPDNSRYISSQMRQGEKPFQNVNVGPGVGVSGFSATPTGGFHQFNSRDYVMPKTVDELRVASKPKASAMEGRLNPGNLSSGSRGKIGRVNKNRVDTYYRNSPDRYFKTGGAVKAPALRDKCYAKPTNRRFTRSHYGAAQPADHTKPYKTGAYRKTRKHNYMNQGPRNATAKDGWIASDEANKEAVGDYGKGSIENKPNERDITQKRTVVSNFTTEVKKLITPIQDVFRMTRKENFVGNPRPNGNMNAEMPSKMTVYDPDDVARTTIKETNIHNEHDGFIKGNEKQQVFDSDDVARTTIKETNIHHKAPHINLMPQQPTSIRVYDPEDIPRATIKDVTGPNDHTGFINTGDRDKVGGYTTSDVKMRNTNKQFISDNEYVGIANADVETGGGRGYLSSKYRAKHTHKQFLSNNEYKGHAGSDNERPMSYADKYNARLNPNKERISRGRRPTGQGPKVAVGQDQINLQYRKLETDRINTREPSETYVYQAPPQMNSCGLTTVKDKLPEDIQRGRMNADVLNAFRQNPYSQSLNSAV